MRATTSATEPADVDTERLLAESPLFQMVSIWANSGTLPAPSRIPRVRGTV